MMEDTIEVFIDDFLVVGNTLDWCLSHLAEVLKKYEDYDLVLNWKKMSLYGERGYIIGTSHLVEGYSGLSRES